MKINSSTVGMESARSYMAANFSVKRFEVTDFSGAFLGTGLSDSELSQAGNSDKDKAEKSSSKNGGEDIASKNDVLDLQQRMAGVRRNYMLRSREHTSAETIRQQTIKYIFDLLFGESRKRFKEWIEENTNACVGKENGVGYIGNNSQNDLMNVDAAKTLQTPVRVFNYVETNYSYESEETTFSTTGTVKTADGREINFNIDVSMSREFESMYHREMGLSFVQTCDPLVINLDGDIASVSDQKIRFDIDGDGELDTINQLAAGSGYLALDKNGDGKINDGNELFGAKSGDGFSDLAMYDDDGNGWIDENDEVWNKLKIWTTDENGKEHLYTLAEAGVGALCLQKVATQFANTDTDNNSKAFIRSSGVFLYENGLAGTLQHMDLVKYKQEA